MKLLKFLLGVAISALFLFLVLRQVSIAEILGNLEGVNYFWLVLAVSIHIGVFFIRSWRWKYLLDPVKKGTRPLSLFPVLMTGFAANNVFPFRLGEFIRAYAAGRQEKISKSASLGTIVVERVFDGSTLVVFLLLSLVGLPFPEWVKRVAMMGATLFAVAMVCVYFALYKPQIAFWVIDKSALIFPHSLADKFSGLIRSFLEGLRSVKKPQDALRIVAMSFLVWFVEAFVFLTAAGGFPFSLSYRQSAMLMAVIAMGIIVPSAPGYIGTFEFFGVGTLALFGIERGLAASFMLVFHGLDWLVISGVGLLSAWKLGLNVSTYKSEIRSTKFETISKSK